MRRTVKGKLALSVILIVIATILVCIAAILTIAGKAIIDSKKSELKLQSEKYAEELNTWIQKEKMVVEDVARNIEIQKSTDEKFLSELVHGYAADREELQNLYCGTAKSVFIKTIEGDTFEGYNPVERSWYIQAAEKGSTIMMDPYIDAVTGEMCASFATPVYFDDELVAVAGSDVSLEKVSEIVNSIDYDEGVYGFLTDTAGNYITHENKDFTPSADNTTLFTDIVPALKNNEGKIIKSADYNGKTSYFSVIQLQESGWRLGIAIPASDVVSSLALIVLISFGIQGFAIIFCIFIINRLTKRLLEPIQTLKLFASGDFSENAVVDKEIPPEYKDETEQITVATANVRKQIREIILDTKEEAYSISMISSKISDIVNGLSHQSREADSLTREIHTAGIETGQAVDNIAGKAVDMAGQANDIKERARSLYAASEKSRNKTSGLYASTKEELEKAIEESKRIDEIRGLAADILSISSQTTILALNASVEAARAGEAGNGFAVVAGEIRVLAEHSKSTADKITSIMDVIISSVDKLSEQADALLSFINNNVKPDYAQMISVSRQYEKDAEYFCSVSSDLGASSEEMSASVANINESIGLIAELVNKISNGMETIEKTATGNGDMSDTGSLAGLSNKLTNTVSAFKV